MTNHRWTGDDSELLGEEEGRTGTSFVSFDPSIRAQGKEGRRSAKLIVRPFVSVFSRIFQVRHRRRGSRLHATRSDCRRRGWRNCRSDDCRLWREVSFSSLLPFFSALSLQLLRRALSCCEREKRADLLPLPIWCHSSQWSRKDRLSQVHPSILRVRRGSVSTRPSTASTRTWRSGHLGGSWDE